jgi:hypothetical protein
MEGESEINNGWMCYNRYFVNYVAALLHLFCIFGLVDAFENSDVFLPVIFLSRCQYIAFHPKTLETSLKEFFLFSLSCLSVLT